MSGSRSGALWCSGSQEERGEIQLLPPSSIIETSVHWLPWRWGGQGPSALASPPGAACAPLDFIQFKKEGVDGGFCARPSLPVSPSCPHYLPLARLQDFPEQPQAESSLDEDPGPCVDGEDEGKEAGMAREGGSGRPGGEVGGESLSRGGGSRAEFEAVGLLSCGGGKGGRGGIAAESF